MPLPLSADDAATLASSENGSGLMLMLSVTGALVLADRPPRARFAVALVLLKETIRDEPVGERATRSVRRRPRPAMRRAGPQ